MRVFQGQKNKAQQLVEFALVAPILVSIIAIAIELGFILNEKAILADATKMAIAKSFEYAYTPAIDKDDKINQMSVKMKDDIFKYIAEHRDITADPEYSNLKNQIDVSIISTSGTDGIVIATYVYNPVFTLPNILGGNIIPDRYILRSSQVISNSILEPSTTYFLTDTTNLLLSTCNLTSTTKTTFNGSPVGNVGSISASDAQSFVAFLVDNEVSLELKNWNGISIFPNCTINRSDLTLEGASCPYPTGEKYYNHIPSTKSQIIYTDDDSNWCTGSGACANGDNSSNNVAFSSTYNIDVSNNPDPTGTATIAGSIDPIETAIQECKTSSVSSWTTNLIKFCVPHVYQPPSSFYPTSSDEYDKLTGTGETFSSNNLVTSKWQ